MTDESFDPEKHIGESVTFRGTAHNAAAGAIVTVGAAPPIYVDGLDEWSEDVEGKSIEITGVLRLQESDMPAPAPGQAPMHGVADDTFVLDGADWMLIDQD